MILLLAVFRKTNVIGLIPSKLVSLVVVLATLVLLVLFNTGGFSRFFCIKGVIDCFCITGVVGAFYTPLM